MRRLNPPGLNGAGGSAAENAGASIGESGAGSAPASPESRAVIVLTSPVTFEDGADLRPVEADLPADAKVFYVRYQPYPTAQLTGGRRPGARHTPDGLFMPPRSGFSQVWDQLAAVLKPAEPRLFDVTTPEQFRRALAAVLAEIAKM